VAFLPSPLFLRLTPPSSLERSGVFSLPSRFDVFGRVPARVEFPVGRAYRLRANGSPFPPLSEGHFAILLRKAPIFFPPDITVPSSTSTHDFTTRGSSPLAGAFVEFLPARLPHEDDLRFSAPLRDLYTKTSFFPDFHLSLSTLSLPRIQTSRGSSLFFFSRFRYELDRRVSFF